MSLNLHVCVQLVFTIFQVALTGATFAEYLHQKAVETKLRLVTFTSSRNLQQGQSVGEASSKGFSTFLVLIYSHLAGVDHDRLGT